MASLLREAKAACNRFVSVVSIVCSRDSRSVPIRMIMESHREINLGVALYSYGPVRCGFEGVLIAVGWYYRVVNSVRTH